MGGEVRGSFRAARVPAVVHPRERHDENCPNGQRPVGIPVSGATRCRKRRNLIRQWRTDRSSCVFMELLAEEGRLMSVSKRLLALMSALLVAVFVVAGCGGGGASSSSGGTLTLGNIGWQENIAVANLTKAVLEEDLNYDEVELKTLDVGLLFEGVAGGDLDAFQDVWIPNHTQLLSEVENDVEHLDPWYEGTTSFGLAVPSYMKGVNSIADLNQSGAERIIGIEPGAVISTKIEENVIPEYNLNLEHEPSSTAAMLAEVERLYNDKEDFVFSPWCPHPMCGEVSGWQGEESARELPGRFDFRFLEDPKNAQV